MNKEDILKKAKDVGLIKQLNEACDPGKWIAIEAHPEIDHTADAYPMEIHGRDFILGWLVAQGLTIHEASDVEAEWDWHEREWQ
jgi:hypothetical protein